VPFCERPRPDGKKNPTKSGAILGSNTPAGFLESLPLGPEATPESEFRRPQGWRQSGLAAHPVHDMDWTMPAEMAKMAQCLQHIS